MLGADRLRYLLNYDKYTGIFTWKNPNTNAVKVGAVAGTNHNDYIRINIDNKLYKAHRLAWLYEYGEFPVNEIDHIDRNGLNNAISNLRDVTTVENHRNKGMFKNNTSGFNGVRWDKTNQRWKASIRVNRKVVSLGSFKDKDEAIEARKLANVKYGFHENHGKRKGE